jgi:ABC-type uncharacterized transport system ATPase subunit
MQKGKIMTIDTLQGIIDKFPQKVFAIKADNMSRLLDDLRNLASVKSCHTFGEFHHLTFLYDNENLCNEMKNHLQGLGHKNIEIKEVAPTIEDCFMDLTDSQK